MKQRLPDRETLLEVGPVVSGGALPAGVWALVLGRTTGGVLSSRRPAEAPPSPGSVPPERRQNIIVVASQ